MKTHIDLHMHSNYSSDGDYSVAELVESCMVHGIKTMAICDHNSAKANKEARAYISDKGYDLQYINGIEIDCIFKSTHLHILGLGIEDSDDFLNLEQAVVRQEQASSELKLNLTNKLGFNLCHGDMKRVAEDGVYYGEKFAEVLLEDPRYMESEILKPYRPGGDRADNPFVNFYWEYYSEGKPCYTETGFPDLEEIIDLIHRHKGLAILAHPGQSLKEGQSRLLEDMAAIGLDGIEVFSSYHDEATNDSYYN